MGEITNINEARQEMTNLLEQLSLDSAEDNLQAIAVCYICNDGEVNYTWCTPKNTIKTIGGVEMLKQSMIERCVNHDG